jgi:hypothetical protein
LVFDGDFRSFVAKMQLLPLVMQPGTELQIARLQVAGQ